MGNGGGSYGENMNVDYSINEENIDTHVMDPSSQINKVELISTDLSCCDVILSPI